MKTHKSLVFVLAVGVIVAALVMDVVGQRKRKTNPSSAPAPTKILSRALAADLIKRDSEFRSTHDADVPVGRFWYNPDDIHYRCDNIEPLEKHGVLTLTQTGKAVPLLREYLVQLTSDGEVAAKSWSKGTTEEMFMFLYGPARYGLPARPEGALFHIPLAAKQLVAVTGIVFDPSKTRAQVEFTWKWVSTPNAKFLPKKVPSDTIHSNAEMCALYDDGWRCSWRPY